MPDRERTGRSASPTAAVLDSQSVSTDEAGGPRGYEAGYAGEQVAKASRIIVKIVRKAPGQIGFVVQPRRWVVKWFFGWIARNRRVYCDVEARIAAEEAFLYAASPMTLVRRLSRCLTIPVRPSRANSGG